MEGEHRWTRRLSNNELGQLQADKSVAREVQKEIKRREKRHNRHGNHTDTARS